MRDVIYDPEAGRLVGLSLNQRGFLAGRRHEVLPAEAIRAIGQDAVMVLDEASLVAPADAPEDVAHPATERNVLGDDVLTEGGASLGKGQQTWSCWLGAAERWSATRSTKQVGGRGDIPRPAELAVSGVRAGGAQTSPRSS